MATIQVFDAAESEGLPDAPTPSAELQACVLLIEDSEDAMLLVRHALQGYRNGKYRLEWARNLDGGLQQISKGGIDIVLLDLGLPDSSGASSCSRVRQIAPEVPILVLTGDMREETEFAAIHRGADDYLIKNEMSGALLVQAIQAAFDLKRENQMRKLATDTKSRLCELIQPAAKDAELRKEHAEITFLPEGF